MLAIRFLRGTEIHGHAVLYDFVLFQNLIEDLQRTPAIDHEIFRDYFEPIDQWLAAQDVVVMRRAQSDADSVVCKSVETIPRHCKSSQILGWRVVAFR